MKTYNHHHHHNHHINDQELFVNPQMIKMVVTNTVHQVHIYKFRRKGFPKRYFPKTPIKKSLPKHIFFRTIQTCHEQKIPGLFKLPRVDHREVGCDWREWCDWGGNQVFGIIVHLQSGIWYYHVFAIRYLVFLCICNRVFDIIMYLQSGICNHNIISIRHCTPCWSSSLVVFYSLVVKSYLF